MSAVVAAGTLVAERRRMRTATLVTPLAALLAVAACQRSGGGAPDAVGVDGAVPDDAATEACAGLQRDACLARGDCHAEFEIFDCRNILGYCAEFTACADGEATCIGGVTCDDLDPEPSCPGPFVVSYTPSCDAACVRADQCAGCRDSKMSFTQSEGCANDGSVEFCIPPALQHAVDAIAPGTQCAPGGGRAGCDPRTQLLCQFATDEAACTSPGGALTDEAWDTLCAISMLPDVVELVPTFFE
jgi:hypothetical protein